MTVKHPSEDKRYRHLIDYSSRVSTSVTTYVPLPRYPQLLIHDSATPPPSVLIKKDLREKITYLKNRLRPIRKIFVFHLFHLIEVVSTLPLLILLSLSLFVI